MLTYQKDRIVVSRSRRLVIADIIQLLSRNVDPEHDPVWLEAVRLGRWSAIPADLGYYDSAPLAYLINGYRAAKALGAMDASDLSAAEWARYDPSESRWAGSAIELWITLFFMHRADHFTSHLVPVDPPPDYTPPDFAPPRPELDALCHSLRDALMEGRHWPEP